MVQSITRELKGLNVQLAYVLADTCTLVLTTLTQMTLVNSHIWLPDDSNINVVLVS